MDDEILSSYIPIVVTTLITSMVTFGLTYLFYPALIVAWHTQLPHAPRVEHLITTDSTRRDENVLLSVVIPSYNEELRLPVMLDEAYSYLSATDRVAALKHLRNVSHSSQSSIVEWIVVDDGSTDATGEVFRSFATKQQKKSQQTQNHQWKLITLLRNSGKGAAVQTGMLHAKGSYCLMVDADGATSFGPGLEAITSQMLQYSQGKNTTETTIWLGSRADLRHGQPDEAVVDRSLVRRFVSAVFHQLRALTLGGKEIADTQCGFKLFPAPAARSIFTTLHLQRWAFDIEVVYLALHLSYNVREVVVPWHEVEGSKLSTNALSLALVSLSMLRDMICVRLCYQVGIWTVNDRVQADSNVKW